tara:strand:- start:224 stop:325 length:102 start_codon:yes stop_codon:yes gene_type:complete
VVVETLPQAPRIQTPVRFEEVVIGDSILAGDEA